VISKPQKPFWFGLISLFPQMFSAVTENGVSSRAIKDGLATSQIWNPRDFTTDKHRTVDDRPFGGGPGMLMKVQPIADAIQAATDTAKSVGIKPKVIYLSPQGKPLTQPAVEKMAKEPGLILLSGRYEGIDERLLSHSVDQEWSIGDYVISGGELAAMVLMDAVIRQLPGALGHDLSAQQDSFSTSSKGLLDCPHYTRPEEFAGDKVPAILLSGDHEKINRWRLKQSLGRTWKRRPDLLQQLVEQGSLSKLEQLLLDEFIAETKVI